MDEARQEYDEDLIAVLEGVWGEGFLSPGYTEEVDLVLEGLCLKDKSVLDIGCGVGGVDVHIAGQHGAALVTGIDIEEHLIERCVRLAERRGVADSTRFICVESGPLGFDDGAFDVVMSKDSIAHIPDKHTLTCDIYRVLKPGGWFAASDWLAGYDGEPSSEMQRYIEAEGLPFGFASASTYQDALKSAGFIDVQMRDRNAWYCDIAIEERGRLAGSLYESLGSTAGKAFLDHEIDVWDKMIVALERGDLRPTHLRGRRPV